jgi:DNA polymerase-3 subunit beta
MKFTADKNTFYEAVTTASKACALKSALNILDGVLLSLEQNTLTITGYDLELGVRVSIKADGIENGQTVADPRLLSEMVKRMPGDSVDFVFDEADSSKIRISSGKSRSSLPSRPAAEFPMIIEMKRDLSFDISEKLCKELFTRVGFAVSRIQPELECIRIDIENNTLYAVGTDGNRLAAKRCSIENADVSFSMPDKAAASLLRVLSDDDDSKINISVDKNQICITKPDFVLISRLIEGKGVNYKRIIEDSPFPHTLTVNVRELTSAMERALLLQSDKLRIPVTCTFTDDSMRLECKTTVGAVDEEIAVTFTQGNLSDLDIRWNPRFMLEALQKATCDEVMIGFDSSLKPIRITPLDNNGEFIFIIVPIRSS